MIEQDDMFLSHDVVSLTKTPINETLDITKKQLEIDTKLKLRTNLNVDDILELLKFIVTTTHFSFRGAIYQQKQQLQGRPQDDDSKHWALIVVGSKGYHNYRHQADACHAYQIMLKHGIPEERIVLMMYDDVAHDRRNPTPGVLINHPNGSDVYGGVKIDYRGKDVTPTNFLNVLLGKTSAMKGIGSRKVINSFFLEFIMADLKSLSKEFKLDTNLSFDIRYTDDTTIMPTVFEKLLSTEELQAPLKLPLAPCEMGINQLPITIYGGETWTLRSQDIQSLEVVEMRS
ncbi:hypothetical protein LSAT2_019844 [Lamellibrachia satsuma]|nr:hypothetical protein LSAT2_019844 [Lamellibrachia satsuma]